MVTLRHTPPGPPDPDDDPTGMRALLSSLPDPGPMPDDLVARITASLAAEQGGRHVVPLHDAPRRKRALWRTAGLAAAAAAVVGIGAGTLLTNTAPGALGALFGGSGNDSAASGAAVSREASAGAAPSSGGAFAQSAGAAVTIHHSNTPYTSAHLADQARALLTSSVEPVAPLSAESPGLGPIATEVGLRSCLSALTTEPFTTATADLGSFDGRPAAVVVLTRGAGHTAYAVQRSCSTGHPAQLAGPVRLP